MSAQRGVKSLQRGFATRHLLARRAQAVALSDIGAPDRLGPADGVLPRGDTADWTERTGWARGRLCDGRGWYVRSRKSVPTNDLAVENAARAIRSRRRKVPLAREDLRRLSGPVSWVLCFCSLSLPVFLPSYVRLRRNPQGSHE
jgi:hypothetical protein